MKLAMKKEMECSTLIQKIRKPWRLYSISFISSII